MTNDQQICKTAEAKYDKPLFILRMVRVIDHQRFRIIEDSSCLLKSYGVLFLIDRILVFIPFESDPIHNYIIIIK